MALASPPITGVILAGGRSSRMGQNKALMTLGGQRLIDRVVAVMRQVFPEVLLVTNTPAVYADLGLPMVPDMWPDAGSLGGICSALSHATTPACAVVACDMPFLQAPLWQYLIAQLPEADVVVPEVLGEVQTLHAIYRQTCRAPMERCVAAKRLRIIGFFPEVRVRRVSASELTPYDPQLLAFQNLNTPEEFQAAEARLSGEAGRS